MDRSAASRTHRRAARRFTIPVLSVLVLALSASPGSAGGSPQEVHSTWRPFVLDPGRQVTVVLELGGAPVAVHEAAALGSHASLSSLDQATLRNGLRVQQDALRPSLAALGARVLGQYQDAYNGIKVRVGAGNVARLGRLPGVQRVVPVPVYQRANVTSDKYTGVPAAWAAQPTALAMTRRTGGWK